MVARRMYTPQRGDIVWINFDPRFGREQKGHRPGVVMTPKEYNALTNLALVCPATSRQKNYPFEVPFRLRRQDAVILADQLTCVDWKQRKVRFVGKIDPSALRAAVEKVAQLLTEEA